MGFKVQIKPTAKSTWSDVTKTPRTREECDALLATRDADREKFRVVPCGTPEFVEA